MRGWEVAHRRLSKSLSRATSFQEWVDLLLYAGNSYPMINQTMTGLSEEEMIRTTYQAYKQNGPIFALTMCRLQIFSQARFQWTRFEKGRPSELFGSPDLVLLERPYGATASGTTSDLLARMEVDVTRAGNAFIRRGNRRVHRLPPEWMTVVIGSQMEGIENPAHAPDAELAGYLFWPGGKKDGKAIVYTPDEIAHYAPYPDPDTHFLGMSWISSVMTDVTADDAATVHKGKFFANAATPNMSITFDPRIAIEQVREFKELLESEHKGMWNAYKTLYLGGGADAKVLGKDFKELDFAATTGKGESRLASAAGIPPSWVGFSEGLQGSSLNAGNFSAARRRMSDGTMAHLWANAASSLETIVPKPPPKKPGDKQQNLHLWYDTRGVPFLREDASEAAKIQQMEAATITALVREGFTAESVIAAVENQDWSKLEHTGRLSVQLQEPGETDDSNESTEPPSDSDDGSTEPEGEE